VAKHKIFQNGSGERVPTGNDAVHIHGVIVGTMRKELKGKVAEKITTEKKK
jgi:hypothetical protein